jgi:class 3 adenylate cyclase
MDEFAKVSPEAPVLLETRVPSGVLDSRTEIDISTLTALKKMPVDLFDGIYLEETKNESLILCIDIRNFSIFLRESAENAVFDLIKNFTSNFLSCVNQFGYHCSYYKLVGDGAIIIWDEASENHLAEALAVFNEYREFLNNDLFIDTPILGLAGALVLEKVFKYEISAEASGLKYRDYVGYGINLACRLQTLAEKDELIINKKLITGKKLSSVEKDKATLSHDIAYLKGLRDEDREKVYMYKHNGGRGKKEG